jgi:hypothetical protein
MNRKQCLETAEACILKNRDDTYGPPEDSFDSIAALWNAYLGIDSPILESHDVAAMMALLKIARIRANPTHADSWADLAGYAACGAECAHGQTQAFRQDFAELEGWSVK